MPQDSEADGTTPIEDVEKSLEVVEERHGDDWYAKNPDWAEGDADE